MSGTVAGSATRADRVDVEPLRRAFLRSGVSRRELADRMGWTRPDSHRVSVALGLSARSVGKEQVSLKLAGRLARAMDVDPTDVGI
jgi:hypothetical protein